MNAIASHLNTVKTYLEEASKAETTIHSKLEAAKAKREQKKLLARANRAEEYAVAAIVFALAAVEEAEVAILEAVVARMDAETEAN